MVRLIQKSGFQLKDKVYFDDFEKSGVITALNKDKLTIFTGESVLFRHPQTVYKKEETFRCGHWDILTKSKRIRILNKHKVSKDLANRDWHYIPGAIKQAIYKDEGSGDLDPTGTNTDLRSIYNPVGSDKTVTDRIKEELAEQSEEGKKDESKDEKKDENSVKKSIKNFINF